MVGDALMKNLEIFGTLAAVALLFAGAIWWTSIVWTECRGSGHSIIYCLQMLRR